MNQSALEELKYTIEGGIELLEKKMIPHAAFKILVEDALERYEMAMLFELLDKKTRRKKMKQTIKDYILEVFQDEPETIADIVKNGMSGGYGPFVYCTDTCAFHDKFEEEIWDMLHKDCEDYGNGMFILGMIAGFTGAKTVGCMDQLKNLLCWYAVEEVCRQIQMEREGGK